MTMRLLGRADSSNVQRVVWALGELGLPHEREDRGGPFGGLDDPAYRALNPAGVVPTLVDGGLAVWESTAILRHLARREGRLWPRAAAGLARADTAMDWTQASFWPAVRVPFQAVVKRGVPRGDDGVRRGATEAARATLPVLDALVRDGSASGEGFALCDIPAAVVLHRLLDLAPGTALPDGVAAWWAAVSARPAFKAAVWVR